MLLSASDCGEHTVEYSDLFDAVSRVGPLFCYQDEQQARQFLKFQNGIQPYHPRGYDPLQEGWRKAIPSTYEIWQCVGFDHVPVGAVLLSLLTESKSTVEEFWKMAREGKDPSSKFATKCLQDGVVCFESIELVENVT